MGSTNFQHGVSQLTLPTQLRATLTSDVLVPVVVGLAPVHKVKGGASMVNVPYLALDYGDTVATFGETSRFSPWTLSEFIYAAFTLFNAYDRPAPILINVFDPAVHKTDVAQSSHPVVQGVVTVQDTDVIRDSVHVVNGTTTLVEGTDYLLSYNDDEHLAITVLLATPPANLSVAYSKADTTAITASDIIGGIDATTEARTGLEVINGVFTALDVVPGYLIAPGYSQDPLVGTVMDAKVQSVDGLFHARCGIDIDPATYRTTTAAVTGKGAGNFTDSRMDLFWPKALAGGIQFHLSTLWAVLQGVVAIQNGGYPYASASNKRLPIQGLCLADGTAVNLNRTSANYLNANGISTAVWWRGGWFSWGNRTAAYPISSDPAQMFACAQTMMDYVGNTTILDEMQDVDQPLDQRHIQRTVDNRQLFLNGLVSSGALIAGRIDYLAADNAPVNLLNGQVTYHYKITPPPPAESNVFELEFDVTAIVQLSHDIGASAAAATPATAAA